MIDFRNDNNSMTEEEIKIREQVRTLEDKLDALEIIKALDFRLNNLKKHSFTINNLHSSRVFYKLSGILTAPALQERGAHIFEGPDQSNITYSIILGDGRLLTLTMMEIYNQKKTSYLFSTRCLDEGEKDNIENISYVSSLSEIIDYFAELYSVRDYGEKGNSRKRNQ